MGWDRILYLHFNQPYLFVSDSFPILFGLTTYFFARIHYKLVDTLANQISGLKIYMDNILDFSNQLRRGNTTAKYELQGNEDFIGDALIQLRNNIVNNLEDQLIRRTEDDQRNWATEGMARFGEILRLNTDNIENLSYGVISNLIKYLNAVQGGFFYLNDINESDIHFQQTASYAYSRKKFVNKRIEFGEGLVGACALEKEMTVIDNITSNYLKITSGLGNTNPSFLLLVPLKTNNEIYGVLEIASFEKLEDYKIGFIEKLSESIAITVKNFKISHRTAMLLKESQLQAEIMQKQEDQVRRNLQELRKTQLEAARQSEEFISFTNSVNHTMIRAEYDVDGTLSYANTKFMFKMGYLENAEVEGKHILTFIHRKDHNWFKKIWEDLAKGGRHFEDYMKHVTRDGKDLWTISTYTCIRNPDATVKKILFLGIDITDQKKQSLDYEAQIEALNRSTIKIELNQNANIVQFNAKFSKTVGYIASEIEGKSLFDFLEPTKIDNFKTIWTKVLDGLPFEGQLKLITKNGIEKWFQSNFLAIHDMYGIVSKIIYIANDITEQKNSEFKIHQQAAQLRDQEQKLQEAGKELSRKLEETREEMKRQFRRTEIVKLLNEKTLEGTLDAIVSINNDGVIVFYNQAAEQLWGYSKEQVMDKNIDVLLPVIEEEPELYMGTYFHAGQLKIIGERKEVFIINANNERVNVLITLSMADIGNDYRLTAFIQRIEVELF